MPESMILNNIGQLVTMAGGGLGVVAPGAVRVRDGRIAEVAGHDMRPVAAEPVVDCRGCVVLPGFVDPHTHLVFGGWRAEEFEQRLAGRSYREIAEAGGGILSSVRATRAASEDELYRSARDRLREMVSWGTTTVEVKSGYGLDTETELKMLRVVRRLADDDLIAVVPTFLGAHSIPVGTDKLAYMRLLEEEMMPAVAEQRLARYCDVFCENFLFDADDSARILEAGKEHGLVPRIHADEIESSGGAEVAARVGAVSASHLLRPADDGLVAMAGKGVIAELLPGTCFFLKEAAKPPVARMRELGVEMALATDCNPGSSTVVGQPMSVVFGCLVYGLTIPEALRGVTVNAARALGLDSEVGTLEPGKRADIVVTDVPDYRHIAYRVGHNPVRVAISQGRVVHRRSD